MTFPVRRILPRWGRIFSTIAALAALAALASPARADVLIDNVDGLTLDDQGAIARFNGLLIGGDGRIEQVLQRADKRPGKVDYRLDGKGRVLMPGLVDSHVRLMEFGLSLLAPGERPPGEPRPEDRDQALARAQEFLLSRGVTALADMGTTITDWQTYRRAGDLGRLNLRIMAYAGGIDDMILIGGPGPTPWLYGDRLRLNGLHLVLDGSLAARGALLKAPYAESPAKSGAALLTDTQFKNLMSRAAMDRFQVAVTASGDKAAASFLDAIGEMSATYPGERRWRIEGADLVDAADAAALGKAGAIASMQPRAAIAGRAMAEERLGPERAARAWAWKSLADAGVRLTFGSGAPSGPVEPFAALAAAITRQGADGQPFGGWQPQERIGREAALSAHTASAAWAGHGEGRFGCIARGQRADFVLVDRDVTLAAPDEIRAARVFQTWVGGRLVWEAKTETSGAVQPGVD